MQEKSNIKKLWLLVLFMHGLHFLPYLINPDFYIRIHDTLEGELGWYHLHSIQPEVFSTEPNQVIPQSMTGLPRDAVPGPFNLVQVIIQSFGTFHGYAINRFLVHMVAFWSMWWLVGLLGFTRDLQIKAGLIYSLVAFFSVFGIAVAGLPAIWASGKTITEKPSNLFSWLVLLLFPFWASAIWGLPGSILILAGITIGYFLKNKKLPIALSLASCMQVLLFALSMFPQLRLMTGNTGFESHRAHYIPEETDITGAVSEFLRLLFIGHYHTGLLLSIPIMLLSVFTLGKEKPFRWIFPAILAICTLQVFYSLTAPFWAQWFPFVVTVQPNRIHVLLPMLWVILYVRTCAYLEMKAPGRFLPSLVLGALLINGFATNDEILHNYRNLLGFKRFPGHQEYVAKPLFDAFKKHTGINPEKEKVICLGFPPSIAWFNGLYTLDGLHANYDYKYKMRFYRIMEDELRKNPAMERYFLNWGNRCFLFSAELGFRPDAFIPTRHQGKFIKNLKFNPDAFKALGGQYLISAVPINTDHQNRLLLKEIISAENWAWSLYIYSVFSDRE